MIKAIHIDDDKRALELMKTAARDNGSLSLVASFTSGDEAAEWLGSNSCDVIFLDIDMPGKNGIELAHELADYNADIIFITSHTGFAVEAFEVCAVDYLLKPIYAEKLNKAMERYSGRKKKHSSVPEEDSRYVTKEQLQQLMTNYKKEELYPKRIFISMVGEIKILNLADIIYFGASGTYTKIYLLSGEVITSSESIKSYAMILLKHPDFVRIHRSFLINKQQISSVQRQTGNINVIMRNGDTLAIAQQRRNEIFQQITG